MSNIIDIIKIILFVSYPLIIGSSLGFLYRPDDWFKNIKKPSFMPPSYVFQYGWTILYILIGISSYYGYYNKDYIYWILPTIHMISNFMFSPIMFGYHNILGGFIFTFLTLILAILVIIQYYYTKSNILSIYLLIPYIMWLIFANILAYTTYIMNK